MDPKLKNKIIGVIKLSTKVLTGLKLSCSQQDLHSALSAIGRATTEHGALPILKNILIQADEDKVKLSATNLELTMVTTVDARIEQPGSITLPYKLLSQFVGSSPNETINIELDNMRAKLQCLKYSARIPGMAAGDFPPIPEIKNPISLRIKSGDLKAALNHVLIAVAPDISRPILSGISLNLESNTLKVAAADSIRLAIYSLNVDAAKAGLQVIMPGKSAQELARLLSDEDEDIEIKVGSQNINFILPKVELYSLLILGEYPQYEKLIPKEFNNKAIVDRQDLLGAVKIVSIFIKEDCLRLVMTPGGEFTPGKLTLYTKDNESGDSESEVDAIIKTPNEAKIAFTDKLISEGLNVIEADQVSIETTSPNSPCIIKPVSDEPFIYVVMPRFTNW